MGPEEEFEHPDFDRPPPGKNRRLPLILVSCGLGCLGCAALLGGLMWFGLSAAMDEFEDQVEAELRDNPILLENIGRLQSFELDFIESSRVPGDQTYVFEVEGERGSGKVIAECVSVSSDREAVVEATLVLEGGERIDLVPKKPKRRRRR